MPAPSLPLKPTVGQDELYEIATTHLDDLRKIAAALLTWVNSHPEAVAEDL